MKQTVNFYDFSRAFQETRPNNFTYAGLRALFDYLEEYEQDSGEELEFDVISLCCDFAEYESVEEFEQDHPDIPFDQLPDYTTVIDVDGGGLIIQAF